MEKCYLSKLLYGARDVTEPEIKYQYHEIKYQYHEIKSSF